MPEAHCDCQSSIHFRLQGSVPRMDGSPDCSTCFDGFEWVWLGTFGTFSAAHVLGVTLRLLSELDLETLETGK